MTNLEKAFEAVRNIEGLSFEQRMELIKIIGNVARKEYNRGWDKVEELNKKYK